MKAYSIARLAWGLVAGVLAGVTMLLVMVLLRAFFYIPTVTELIFDRAFPFITVKFFIDSLVRAGGYTPLKLQGVAGAFAGQLGAAGFGGIIYAWYVGKMGVRDPRGWRLIIPGVLGVWALFVFLLWPQLLTNYRGHPPDEATLLSIAGILIGFGSCGAALVGFYALLTAAPAPAAPQSDHLTRRRFIAAAGAAVSTLALGAVLRRLFAIGSFSYDGTEYAGPQVIKITPTDKFYQVTKNLVDPDVARDIWRIEFKGNIEAPHVYDYKSLTAMPAVEQEITIQCISYRVGGGLISNAVWKGVPLKTLVEAAKPKPDTSDILFHAADGYFETFPYSKAIDPTTMVAWGMNGGPIPARHGFPVRLVVPGLVGERSPKWVTALEFLSKDDPRLQIKRHDVKGVGFYTEQGWGPNHLALTTSRFDAPQVIGDHFEQPFKVGRSTELRGMAFGGDKGISKVEVSFDGAQTWKEVPITQPGTRVSWSLWSYQWTPREAGDLQLAVRATNGDGELQIQTDRNTVPQGATGLHRVRAKVDAA